MIIINNVNFNEARRSSPQELSDRTGSDQDADSLLKTFEGFGFLCITEKNKKGQVSLPFATKV